MAGDPEDSVPDRRGWHIDKGIPIIVIISVLGLVWKTAKDQARQDERISMAELAIQGMRQSSINDQARTEKKFEELKVDLRIIGSKIDRLNENLNRRD
jgi:hypothetical protein